MKKECKNCIHHQGVKTLDDCPQVCWSCSSSSKDKPHFEPIKSSNK